MLATLLLTALVAPQDRLELWKKDIDFATEELAKRHKNLFAKMTKEAWAESAAAAKRELGDKAQGDSADTARLAVAMMRHIARIGDGHTNFVWSQIGLPMCPLQLDAFAEGIFVLGNGSAESRLTGARVLRVEGLELEKIFAKLKPLIAHENEVLLRTRSLQLFAVPGILHAIGIGKDPNSLALTCIDRDGKEFTTKVAAKKPRELRGTKYAHPFEKIPLCLTQARKKHWFRYLEDQKTLYLKYNSCSDGPGFEKVCSAMWKDLGDRPLEKFVIDVRHNGGGSELVILPLFRGLNKRKHLRKGGLYVIIGRRTFSSAMNNAITFRKNFRAKLVGEPTGGKPNHFGEIRPLKLPESRLTIYYSSNYFRKVKGDPPSLEPDIAIDLRAADFFAGKDPFLEAVLADGR